MTANRRKFSCTCFFGAGGVAAVAGAPAVATALSGGGAAVVVGGDCDRASRTVFTETSTSRSLVTCLVCAVQVRLEDCRRGPRAADHNHQ